MSKLVYRGPSELIRVGERAYRRNELVEIEMELLEMLQSRGHSFEEIDHNVARFETPVMPIGLEPEHKPEPPLPDVPQFAPAHVPAPRPAHPHADGPGVMTIGLDKKPVSQPIAVSEPVDEAGSSGKEDEGEDEEDQDIEDNDQDTDGEDETSGPEDSPPVGGTPSARPMPRPAKRQARRSSPTRSLKGR